jgi:hypothetical protein
MGKRYVCSGCDDACFLKFREETDDRFKGNDFPNPTHCPYDGRKAVWEKVS